MMRTLMATVLVTGMLVGLGATQASAAYEFYMTITGGQQGAFAGECQIPGWEHTMPCMALAYEVKVPNPPRPGSIAASGLEVDYAPLTITKPWGAASPQILRALATGEILSEVQLRFVRVTPQGSEETYYTITLRNATVIGWHPRVGNAAAVVAGSPNLLELEEVTFQYEAVTVQFLPTGAATSAGWTGVSPTVAPGTPQGGPTVRLDENRRPSRVLRERTE